MVVFVAWVVWFSIESDRGPDRAESRRGSDRVTEALKVIPADCEVEGVWRREDYPPAIAYMKNTIVICRSPENRQMFMVYDDRLAPAHVALKPDGSNDVNSDVFTINADGSLTISDEMGEVMTARPAAR